MRLKFVSLWLFVSKDQALKGFRLAFEKTATLGSRLDLVFYMIRIGMFYRDDDLTVRNIEKAKR